MYKNYFKTALRNISRSKVYSFINVAGLGLGLTCAMLILLYVKDEVSYDRFHKKEAQIDRIVLKGHFDQGPNHSVNYLSVTGFLPGPKFKAAIPEIKGFVRFQDSHADIKQGLDVISEEVEYADSNFFSEFTFPLLSGNPKTALLQPRSVVLSEQMAIKQFGSLEALGKTLLVKENDAFVPYQVTGVAKRCPENSSIKFDILMPLEVPAGEEGKPENWFSFFLTTFVELSPGADKGSVESRMQKVFLSDAAESLKKKDDKTPLDWRLQPLADMHLSRDIPNQLSDQSSPIFSYILSGIAIFILLIACINFVNLTLARSLNRAKEIGIRKVSGGNRIQLVWQFLGESFLLCLLAFGFALLLAKLVLPLFNVLSNKALSLSYLLDAKLISGYILLFLVTTGLAGFYPALVLSKYSPAQTLYGKFPLASKNYLQKSLVVLQFSLASFLIMATIVIFSQFNFLTTEKLGYDDTNLVLVEKMDFKPTEAKLMKEELLKDPGIVNLTAKNAWFSGTSGKVSPGKEMDFSCQMIDESYFPLLKIPMVEGRNFSASNPADSIQSVMVNEAFVKQAGWKNPIGQQVSFWSKNFQVIGVVKDYHSEPLSRPISPELFRMAPSFGLGLALIKIRPGNKQASLQHIEKVFRTLFPWSPYSYSFKDQENLKNYEPEAKWKQIMLFGALLTILISCFGLFGLSVLAAEKRTREIGIRKVLGASIGRIVSILSIDFLKLVLIALVFSVPLAYMAAQQWLENYPYRISLGWPLFAIGVLLVVLIAMATISFHAIRTAFSDPVKSLRTE
jgi:putative ABC transport system permease protein